MSIFNTAAADAGSIATCLLLSFLRCRGGVCDDSPGDLVVGDHLLGPPGVGQSAAEDPTLGGAGDGDVLRSAGDAQPTHAVRPTPPPNNGLTSTHRNIGVAVLRMQGDGGRYVPFCADRRMCPRRCAELAEDVLT